MRARAAAIAAAGALLVAPAAADAQGCPPWEPSAAWNVTTVSRGSRQFGPVALGVARSGAAVVAWGPEGEFSRRGPGGRFSPPRATGASAVAGLEAAVVGGQVVIAARGRDALRLIRVSGRARRIASVRTDELAPFALAGGTPGLLAWTAGGRTLVARLGSDGPGVAEDAGAGAPLAAATTAGPPPGELLALGSGAAMGVLEREGAAPWGAPATVPTAGFPSSVGAVRSVLGGAGLIWRADAPRDVVESVARRPGGLFGGVQRLSGSPVTSGPVVASTPRGRAFAAWTEDRGDLSELMLAGYEPGGDWGPRIRVLFDRRPLHVPVVAVSRGGRALAVVSAVACGRRVALLSRERSGHRWRAPEVIATWAGYVPDSLRAAFDRSGRLLVAWPRRPRAGGGLTRIPIVVATRRPR